MMSLHSGYCSILGIGALLSLGALPSFALAQNPPVQRIDAPDGVARQQFTLIKCIRELSDGRVIVSDWIEERVIVVDFEAGTTRDLGRVGSGPKEFRLPSRLLALPADSTLLLDYGNGRLIVIGPRFSFVRSFSTRAHGKRYGMNPSATEQTGVLYFALPAWARGPDAPRMDSIPIGSWAQGDASVRLIANVKMKGSTPRERTVSLRPGIPFKMFAKQDGWTVTRDGWLWVQRALPADSAPRLDVFERSGERTLIVTLPRGRAIVGFGSATLYATVADEP